MIRDFAIIDQLTVDFGTNMTVLTGETGAGKSIIIDALGLLAGGRGSSDFIRKGANIFQWFITRFATTNIESGLFSPSISPQS